MGIPSVVGLDIGGTNCRIGIVDINNKLYDPQICLTADLQKEGRILDALGHFIIEYIRNKKADFDIQAISMGFPSTIDKERKTLLSTPNINGLNNIPIVSIYEEMFNLPVFINRDVNILMYHDISYLKIPRESITLGFYIGTGFGNAIYMNGKILLGKHGVAGELGHIPMIGQKKSCTCGNEACVEAYASGRYLEELCQLKFKETNIKNVYIEHSDKDELKQQVEYMSIPIATEVNIFDPDYIVLGGGLLQMNGFPKDMLEMYIYKHVRKPYPAEDLTIMYALSEQENGIIGAGLYAFSMLKETV